MPNWIKSRYFLKTKKKYTAVGPKKIGHYLKLNNNSPSPLVEKISLLFRGGGGAIIVQRFFVKNKVIVSEKKQCFFLYKKFFAVLKK